MILLLGSTGYIGSEFKAEMNRRKLWHVNWPHNEVAGLREAIDQSTPEPSRVSVVINCAAFVCKTSVEMNEDAKCETLLGNLVFPTMVRDACETAGVPLLHVSTGCLYNDSLGHSIAHQVLPDHPEQWRKFTESDAPMLTFDTGAGWYVGSKELAERVVRQYKKSWICRIRLPFDQFDNPRNFLSKLISFPGVVDTRNSMSHRGDFGKACLDMIEQQVPFGTYNCTNPGAIWTHDIAKMLSDATLREHWSWFQWDTFLKTMRRTRMSNAELDVSKLLATGVKMRTVQAAMEDSIANWTKA